MHLFIDSWQESCGPHARTQLPEMILVLQHLANHVIVTSPLVGKADSIIVQDVSSNTEYLSCEGLHLWLLDVRSDMSGRVGHWRLPDVLHLCLLNDFCGNVAHSKSFVVLAGCTPGNSNFHFTNDAGKFSNSNFHFTTTDAGEFSLVFGVSSCDGTQHIDLEIIEGFLDEGRDVRRDSSAVLASSALSISASHDSAYVAREAA